MHVNCDNSCVSHTVCSPFIVQTWCGDMKPFAHFERERQGEIRSRRTHAVCKITPQRKFSNYFINYSINKYELYLTFSIIIIFHARTEFETVPLHVVPNLWRKTTWDRFMYGDKTTHVSITVLFLCLSLTVVRNWPNYAPVQKQCRFSITIGKNCVPRGPHAIARVAWCLNTLLLVSPRACNWCCKK